MPLALRQRPAVTAATMAPRCRARGAARRVFGVPEMGLLILLLVAFVGFTLVNSGFASGPNIESLVPHHRLHGDRHGRRGRADDRRRVRPVGRLGGGNGGDRRRPADDQGRAAGAGGDHRGASLAGALVGLRERRHHREGRDPSVRHHPEHAVRRQGHRVRAQRRRSRLPAAARTSAVLARTDILGIPSSIWVFLLVVVVVDLAMRHHDAGAGSCTPPAAIRSRRASPGIRTDRVKILAFIAVRIAGELRRAPAREPSRARGRVDRPGLGAQRDRRVRRRRRGPRGGAGTIAGAFLGLVLLQGVQSRVSSSSAWIRRSSRSWRGWSSSARSASTSIAVAGSRDPQAAASSDCADIRTGQEMPDDTSALEARPGGPPRIKAARLTIGGEIRVNSNRYADRARRSSADVSVMLRRTPANGTAAHDERPRLRPAVSCCSRPPPAAAGPPPGARDRGAGNGRPSTRTRRTPSTARWPRPPATSAGRTSTSCPC